MSETKLNEIKIQCPECGGMIQAFGIWRMHRCNGCKRYYTEAEVRERCAL